MTWKHLGEMNLSTQASVPPLIRDNITVLMDSILRDATDNDWCQTISTDWFVAIWEDQRKFLAKIMEPVYNCCGKASEAWTWDWINCMVQATQTIDLETSGKRVYCFREKTLSSITPGEISTTLKSHLQPEDRVRMSNPTTFQSSDGKEVLLTGKCDFLLLGLPLESVDEKLYDLPRGPCQHRAL